MLGSSNIRSGHSVVVVRRSRRRPSLRRSSRRPSSFVLRRPLRIYIYIYILYAGTQSSKTHSAVKKVLPESILATEKNRNVKRAFQCRNAMVVEPHPEWTARRARVIATLKGPFHITIVCCLRLPHKTSALHRWSSARATGVTTSKGAPHVTIASSPLPLHFWLPPFENSYFLIFDKSINPEFWKPRISDI